MADTLTRKIIEDQSGKAVVRVQLDSDGTGTTNGILVDRSALAAGLNGTEAGRLVIEYIDFIIDGMQIVLNFDHTTDDYILTLAGNGSIDFTKNHLYQGFIDPNSAGGTGDITGTTIGHTNGDKATIIFYLRKKD